MEIEATKKLFTVDEYYKMVDAGILHDGDRTELIDGEIVEMTAMGSRHAAVVTRVTEVLIPLFRGKALVRPQLPLRLNEFNEPEPDIVLLRPRQDCYSSRHPRPADVFFVLEIAESSLKYDRDVKLPIYAATQVPEVWIADLSGEALLVYRNPSSTSYAASLKFHRGESLFCMSFPEIQLAVEDLLAP